MRKCNEGNLVEQEIGCSVVTGESLGSGISMHRNSFHRHLSKKEGRDVASQLAETSWLMS